LVVVVGVQTKSSLHDWIPLQVLVVLVQAGIPPEVVVVL
jgi:hypothetical protein